MTLKRDATGDSIFAEMSLMFRPPEQSEGPEGGYM